MGVHERTSMKEHLVRHGSKHKIQVHTTKRNKQQQKQKQNPTPFQNKNNEKSEKRSLTKTKARGKKENRWVQQTHTLTHSHTQTRACTHPRISQNAGKIKQVSPSHTRISQSHIDFKAKLDEKLPITVLFLWLSSVLQTLPYSPFCFWHSQPPDSSYQTAFQFFSERNPPCTHSNLTSRHFFLKNNPVSYTHLTLPTMAVV